jgi:D-glycero-D-manno-heptose 1,7-bisphosphate phosphatase
MKSAVFFERDGVLNGARLQGDKPASPLTMDEFKVNEHALEPLRVLKSAGFLVLVTTNQPGLSRGYQSRRELDLMHLILRKRFPIDDILVCPHDEFDRCPCRKPKQGLLIEAAFKWHLDLDRSYVISDKWQDAAAAHNAGCTSVLIQSPWTGSGHRDFIAADLHAAVAKVLQTEVGRAAGNTRELAPRT